VVTDAQVIRTWLEMNEAPAWVPPPPPAGVRVEHLAQCPVALYRRLYSGVGHDWSWFDRLWWTDAELAAYLARPEVRITVLEVDGAPAGFYELVRRDDGAVEIAYFGLMAKVIGRGLGSWLLQAAIADAWSGSPVRLCLNTCTLDHPGALPNYQKHGFVITHSDTVPPPRAPDPPGG
jgi:GNAT superfamily N-acetyltransferase